ncbi:hypothetical protein AA0119_g11537 [Alternaria tenuissima]|uniref:Uncharacterized protein n=1 Tax=Alternaria tenuissima TaxID=119927 RepID=A0AB37VYF6_9PLEO|nr:hypothetical protein AA0115_g12832 [Alternaria tenuissima]RYN89235.1 hypothetical protein AA0119_g11537 [Alternaria tenuissima]
MVGAGPGWATGRATLSVRRFDYRTAATNTAAHSRSRFQTDKQ